MIAPRPPPQLVQREKIDVTGMSFKEILAMRKKKAAKIDSVVAVVDRGRPNERQSHVVENDDRRRSRSRDNEEESKDTF